MPSFVPTSAPLHPPTLQPTPTPTHQPSLSHVIATKLPRTPAASLQDRAFIGLVPLIVGVLALAGLLACRLGWCASDDDDAALTMFSSFTGASDDVLKVTDEK